MMAKKTKRPGNKEQPAKPTLYLGSIMHLRAEDLAKMVEGINGHVSTPDELREAQEDLDEIQAAIRENRPVRQIPDDEYDALFDG
jgi:hypothetical protein